MARVSRSRARLAVDHAAGRGARTSGLRRDEADLHGLAGLEHRGAAEAVRGTEPLDGRVPGFAGADGHVVRVDQVEDPGGRCTGDVVDEDVGDEAVTPGGSTRVAR